MSRVLFHIGTPKTGTSFVQDVLFRNRELLAERGILYPVDRFDDHFLAALDLLELSWGGLEAKAVGAWERLAERVRGWDGTVIVSHEVFAAATRQQVRRALSSFGESEVHVVLSARDLARQLPAEWQENVKHRRTVDFAHFLDRVRDPTRSSEVATWFWAVQEVPDILDRWGSTLPPERVHLVTVPGRDAPRDLLWRRFAGVFGLDVEPVQPTTQPTTQRFNPSLGLAEAELVRRVNLRVNHGVLANEDYRRFVRELLAHRTLSRRVGSARIELPPDAVAWAEGVGRSWVEALRPRGYDVVGSLDELNPTAVPAGGPTAVPTREPGSPEAEHSSASGDPSEDAVQDAALESIVTLLREAARLQHLEDDLRTELATTRAELDRSRSLRFRAKRRLVRSAETNRVAAAGLAAYRWMRESSSRSA
ncbi:MAG: hypothetical protein ACRDPI_09330 [Nocardioidaceae bacterium]